MQHPSTAAEMAPWGQDLSNYNCLECGTLFTSEMAIEAHIQKFHAINYGFTCPHCQRGFKDNWHLSKHVVSHTMGEEPKIMCNTCKKPFKDSWQLSRHQLAGCQSLPQEVTLPDNDPEEPQEDGYLEVAPQPSDIDSLNLCEWTEENGVMNLLPVQKRSPSPPPPPPPQRSFAPALTLTTIHSRAPISIYDFRPAGVSPAQTIEYFCKVCGEVLNRLRFCSHMSGHFPDIFLKRTHDPPRQISHSFFQQSPPGGAARVEPQQPEPGTCRTCAGCTNLLNSLKQTLGSLEDLLG